MVVPYNMASQRQKIQQKNRRCIAFGQEPFIAAIRVPTKEERTSAHGPRQVSRLEATGQKGINTWGYTHITSRNRPGPLHDHRKESPFFEIPTPEKTAIRFPRCGRPVSNCLAKQNAKVRGHRLCSIKKNIRWDCIQSHRMLCVCANTLLQVAMIASLLIQGAGAFGRIPSGHPVATWHQTLSSGSRSSTVVPLSANAAISTSYFAFSALFASRALAGASLCPSARSSGFRFGTGSLTGFFLAATSRFSWRLPFPKPLGQRIFPFSSFASVLAIRTVRSSFRVVRHSIV